MKKIVLASVLAIASSLAMADGVNNNFTGIGIGGEVGATDWSDGGRTVTDVNLVGSYGFAFPATELVGQAELKYKLGNSRVATVDGVDLKAKDTWTLGYVQGYRVTPNIMPYAKVSYINTKVTASNDSASGSARLHGWGLGVGAKFAVAENVELGAEYQHGRLKNSNVFDGTVKTNSFNVGAAVRF